MSHASLVPRVLFPLLALGHALAARPAVATEVSSVELNIEASDLDGRPVSEVESGEPYWYTFNYAIAGNALAGVGAVISVDLPEGLWVLDASAPERFTSACSRRPPASAYNWQFSCTFAAEDLEILGAGGVSGQARVRVISRRYAVAHGDALEAAASLAVVWEGDDGPRSLERIDAHTMSFWARPELAVEKVFPQFLHRYRMMVGPDGAQGTTFYYEISLRNAGSALLRDLTLEEQLPEGAHFVSLEGGDDRWTVAEPVWSSGTLTLQREGDFGYWERMSTVGTVLPSSHTETLVLTVWVPCEAFGGYPVSIAVEPDPAYLAVAVVRAMGFGRHPDGGVVGDHLIERAATAWPADLGRRTCGAGQNTTNLQGGGAREPGTEASFTYHVFPEFASTDDADPVVWFERDVWLGRFSGAALGSTDDDGAFLPYFCDLAGVDTTPATVRGDFLASWRDDPARCTLAPPTTALEWAEVTHVFFHTEVWGDPEASVGYSLGRTVFTAQALVDALAPNDAQFRMLAYFESDRVPLRSNSRVGPVFGLSRPAFRPWGMLADNFPFAAPGERLRFTGRMYRVTQDPDDRRHVSVLPLNPTAEVLLPPGLVYEGSEVLISGACVSAEEAGTDPPGTYVPLVYSSEPAISFGPDGSARLEWSFGDAQSPFRLVGSCPNSTSANQITIAIDARVDATRPYVDGQELVLESRMSADNADPDYPDDVVTRAAFITSPGEMRVDVLPWCEAIGRLGFAAVYENTGGVELTDVRIVFPIPEVEDPLGGTPDVTYFESASSDDPSGEVGFSVDGGVSWTSAAQPDPLTITHVRLGVPSLPALGGRQNFFLNLEVPAYNPGDGIIFASGQMSSAELNDASSPFSLPFVVDTCPQWVTVSKFFDADGDGQRSETERGLGGWTFVIADAAGQAVTSGVTDHLGELLVVLTPGTYTFTELLPESGGGAEPIWAATTPGGVTQEVTVVVGGDNRVVFGNSCACDDGDACTVGSCDPLAGCVYQPITCDDGNACTAASCDPQLGCVFELRLDAACEGGDVCTASACGLLDGEPACVETPLAAGTPCEGGVCDGGAPPSCVECASDADCLAPAVLCHPELATCVACVNDADCADGLSCTRDSCVEGSCSNLPLEAGAACDEGGVCDGDIESPTCRGCLEASNCDDDDPCTEDLCVDSECDHEPRATGSPCPDGVCELAGQSSVCVPCVAMGQADAVDPGCSVEAPRCLEGAEGRACVACIEEEDCADGLVCDAVSNDCQEPPTEAPLAFDDWAVTEEDRAVLVEVLHNDRPEGGLPLSVAEVLEAPRHGQLEVLEDHTLLYTPAPDWSGTDVFVYRSCDSDDTCARAKVRIVATPVNDAPVARDLSVPVGAEQAVVVDVLANDDDIDGDPLAVVAIVAAPEHGTAVIDESSESGESGGVLYTPEPGFEGEDAFTYRVCDPAGLCDEAAVILAVGDDSELPAVPAVFAETVRDEAVRIEALGEGAGSDLTVTEVGRPLRGVAVIDAGSVLYTPRPAFFGEDRFFFSACDAAGWCAMASITVAIARGAPLPPVALDDLVATPRDTLLVHDVTANDFDPDGDALALSRVGTPSSGVAGLSAEGLLTYTPPSGFLGDAFVGVTILDEEGGADASVLWVRVTEDGNAPPEASDDTYAVEEGQARVMAVLDNDVDPDGDALTIFAVVQPLHGRATLGAAGSITYIPVAGYVGVDSLEYAVADGRGGFDSARVDISVEAADVPVEPSPDEAPDIGAEPAPEESPELGAEAGPEPMPEGQPEVTDELDDGVTATGGACQGGAPGRGLAPGLLLVGLWSWGRRRRRVA